jgi:hypothetical protein
MITIGRFPALLAAAALAIARGAQAAEAPVVDLGLWGGIKTTTMRDLQHETDTVIADMRANGMTVVRTATVGPQAGLEAALPLPGNVAACLRAAWLGRDGGEIRGTVSDAMGTASIVEHVTIDGWSVEAGARYARPVAPRWSVRGGLFAGVVGATTEVRLRTAATGLYASLIPSGEDTIPYRASGLAVEALVGIAYAVTPRLSAGLDAGWHLGKTGALKATAAGDSDNDGVDDVRKGDPRRSSDGKKNLTLDFSGLTAVLFLALSL